MTNARHERLTELLAQQRYAAVLDDAVTQLTSLGIPIRRDDAATWEDVRDAQGYVAEQDRFHLGWHRVWGVRLREEVLATSARLAAMLEDELEVLIWRFRPPADWGSWTDVGFLTPVSSALRQLPAHIGPEEGAVGPGGIGSDLLLVSRDGESGLRLEYNHLPNADEYEMRPWGRYARVVEGD